VVDRTSSLFDASEAAAVINPQPARATIAGHMKFLLRRLAGLLHRPDVDAALASSVPAEKPWRSCVCPIESDARDGLNLVNVCAILN
jgi:hypothetical protein